MNAGAIEARFRVLTARRATLGLLLLLTPALVGCGALRPGPAGPLTLRGAHEPEHRLPTNFDTRIYSYDGSDRVTIVLIAGAWEAPERAMTIRLFAEPRPGRTPVARHATNAVVRYARFETAPDGDRRVRVYSGAGFLRSGAQAGRQRLHAAVREATLALIDASPDFANLEADDAVPDALTLRGRFHARRDDLAVARAVRQLEAAIAEALTYPRFVHATGH